MERFALHDPLKAKLVEPRFFSGLSLEESASCPGIALSTAARAWLYTATAGADPGEKPDPA